MVSLYFCLVHPKTGIPAEILQGLYGVGDLLVRVRYAVLRRVICDGRPTPINPNPYPRICPRRLDYAPRFLSVIRRSRQKHLVRIWADFRTAAAGWHDAEVEGQLPGR